MQDARPFEVGGQTRVAFIIAEPISHVRTPRVLNAFARAEGIDAIMVPCAVSPANLAAVLSSLRFMNSLNGAVITAPHKVSAVGACDALSEQAERIGAVNVIRRMQGGTLIGDNFDGRGFVAALKANGIAVAGRSVLMVGAGGVAAAIAFELAHEGAGELRIYNRTPSRAADLAQRVCATHPNFAIAIAEPDPSGAHLVINASSAGMKEDDPPPLLAEGLRAEMSVAEVVIRSEDTRLLCEARKRGCRIQSGSDMLEHQIPLLAGFIGFAAQR